METVKLEDIVTNEPVGYGKEPEVNDFIFPVAKVSNVSGKGQFHKEFELRSFKEKEVRKLSAKPGDLFVVKSSGSKANILSGKTSLYTGEPENLIASNFLLRLRPGKEVVGKYLWYFINSGIVKSYIKTIVGATTYPNLKWSLFKDLPVPFPSLKTQKRIVAILDDAQMLKQKTELLLDDFDELSQSIFLDMFGDPVSNPKAWEIKKLGDICHKITDGTHQGPKFIESGVPFLLVSNIEKNEINFKAKKFISEEDLKDLTKSTPIEKGDLLYTSVGSYGKPAIVRDSRKFCFQRHIAHLKPNHEILDVRFLHAMMASPLVKRQADRHAVGVAQKTLNLKAIKSFNVYLPDVYVQKQFSRKIEKIERQKELAINQLNECEDLFNCLLQKAFKGELV